MSWCTILLAIVSIGMIGMMTLSVFIVAWLDKLKRTNDCQCAQNWKQEYILQFMNFLILWNIAFGTLVIYDMYQSGCKNRNPYGIPGLIFRMFVGIGFFIYLFLAYYYTKMLKEKQCTCAMKDKGYKILKIHASISVAFLVFSLMAPLIVALAFMSYMIVRK